LTPIKENKVRSGQNCLMEALMTYSTLMTHLELETRNDAVCAVSAQLASLMKADVIGIAACQPLPYFTEMPAPVVIEMDRTELLREIGATESQLRAALKDSGCRVTFRSELTYMDLADYVAEEARASDLIITGPALHYDLLDPTRRTDIGALVMAAGRPVLIVPKEASKLTLECAVIAWKDTREARRAVADALPLLKQADRVTVAAMASKSQAKQARESILDVAQWLERHGIKADVHVEPSNGGDISGLHRVLEARNCDLLVAGAYGHSRLREWSFGGVTMDLLISPDRCALISH